MLEEDRKRREETARLRAEDYQMSYALDILHGLTVLNGD
jgi:carboxyl-terminal processing protease